MGFASISVPTGWEANTEDGTTSMYHPMGVGAFQVSFSRAENTQPQLEELTDWFLGRLLVIATKRIWTRIAGVVCLYIEGASEDSFWRIWHAALGVRIARVTYNCAISERESERVIIDTLVDSWQWEPS